MDSTSWMGKVVHLMENKDWNKFVDALQDEQSQDLVYENTDNLLDIIISGIENDQDSRILVVLAELGSPKLMIIGLLSKLDGYPSMVLLPSIIESLGLALSRLEPKPKVTSSQWHTSLNTLIKSIHGLDVPSTYNLDHKERIILEMDHNLIQLMTICKQFLNLLIKFVQQKEMDCGLRHEMCLRAIVMIFERPFSHCNMLKSGDFKEELRVNELAQSYFQSLISKVFPDIYSSLLEQLQSNKLELQTTFGSGEDENEEGSQGISMPGLITLFYSLHNLEPLHHLIPQCYHPQYIFQTVLPSVTKIIACLRDQAQTFKCLDLCLHLLNRIDNMRLSSDILEICNGFFQSLVETITRTELQEMREMSFQTLNLFYRKIEFNGRFMFFRLIHQSPSSPPGLRGWIVTLLKDTVIESLTGDFTPLTGRSLIVKLEPFLVLKGGVATDLVEEKEHILSILNCFGCLKNIPSLELGDYVSKFDLDYCQPLRKDLDICSIYYKKRAEQLQLDGKLSQEPDFIVSNHNVPEPSVSEQLCLLKEIENVLDMIRFTLSRHNL